MKFVPSKSVFTKEPKVVVDGGLPVGKHRFQLVVEDEEGNRSKPSEIVVTIEDKRRPFPFNFFNLLLNLFRRIHQQIPLTWRSYGL